MFRVEKIKSVHAQNVETFNQINVKVIDTNDPKNYCILPENITKGHHLEDIKSMKIYPDDVWIVTNPKCGTTWTQEMVWLLFNDLNYEEAAKIDLDQRIPFVELEGLLAGTPLQDPMFRPFQKILNTPQPRLIKTHLPAFLMPNEIWSVKPKIIYVVRNPKDAAVSWFHHYVNLQGWKTANMDIFINAFVNDRIVYSPFNDHVLKFWEMCNESNILFIHFEDMKRDLKTVAKKVSEFLEKSFTPEEFDKLCDHLSFDKMKNNKTANKEVILNALREKGLIENNWNFIRKGKVGSYKEELTSEQIELLHSYIRQIDADKTDFKYKFQ